MSTCRACGAPHFTLDRTTGEMKCSLCGSPNYVGMPENYNKGIKSEYDKIGEVLEKPFLGNEIFDDDMEKKPSKD